MSGKPNPHAWMSPDNALIYVDNIRDAFIKYDPANAQTYQRNADTYKAKITQTLAPLRKQIAEFPENQRWMVTSEGAFSYLARDLGLKELYLWPINANQQGTPQQVRKVVDIIKKNHIPAVFSESTISDKPARQVARETGAHYGGVLYVDSLSTENGPVPTYIDLLKVTTSTLVQGIKAGKGEIMMQSRQALSLMMLLSPGVTGTQHCAMHPSQYQADLLPLWLGMVPENRRCLKRLWDLCV